MATTTREEMKDLSKFINKKTEIKAKYYIMSRERIKKVVDVSSNREGIRYRIGEYLRIGGGVLNDRKGSFE